MKEVCNKSLPLLHNNTHQVGLSTPFIKLFSRCKYGKEIDSDGFHAITCKNGSGPMWPHISVLCWSECLREVDLHQKTKTKIYRYANV